MDEVYIGVNSWIIQDGNYDDFKVGDKRKFALEFHPHSLNSSDHKEAVLKRIDQSDYEINAQVKFSSEEAMVVDFGLCVYDQKPGTHDLKVGDFVSGTFYIGIDPFFYLEELATIEGMPPLVYEWEIAEILMNTAPLVEEKDEADQPVMVRDKSKIDFKNIEKTDAWNDDGGNAEYILKVKLLETPAGYNK